MNNQIKRLSLNYYVDVHIPMLMATYIQVIDEPNLSADGRNVRTIYNSFNVKEEMELLLKDKQ